jgi:hypothetical protein
VGGRLRGIAIAVAGAALTASLAGCGSGGAKCPKPVAYDAKTLNEIEKALEGLPKDSILHSVMRDYENERDDLRFCK